MYIKLSPTWRNMGYDITEDDFHLCYPKIMVRNNPYVLKEADRRRNVPTSGAVSVPVVKSVRVKGKGRVLKEEEEEEECEEEEEEREEEERADEEREAEERADEEREAEERADEERKENQRGEEEEQDRNSESHAVNSGNLELLETWQQQDDQDPVDDDDESSGSPTATPCPPSRATSTPKRRPRSSNNKGDADSPDLQAHIVWLQNELELSQHSLSIALKDVDHYRTALSAECQRSKSDEQKWAQTRRELELSRKKEEKLERRNEVLRRRANKLQEDVDALASQYDQQEAVNVAPLIQSVQGAFTV
jgi:hypothetical protein